jgi:hypothetical protein
LEKNHFVRTGCDETDIIKTKKEFVMNNNRSSISDFIEFGACLLDFAVFVYECFCFVYYGVDENPIIKFGMKYGIPVCIAILAVLVFLNVIAVMLSDYLKRQL